MKILVTGCAGFIGYHLVKQLVKIKSDKIFGIDNLNNYYDIKLKKNRLNDIKKNKNFQFYKIDITNFTIIDKNFVENQYDIVVHLAAQAGVRYSFIKPFEYINTNINGFINILESSRKIKVKHFIFASSSSVYGNLRKFPYSENQKKYAPISLYASTKLENEKIARIYSNKFKIPCTGLRFFTVYGPSGRPDMSLFKFVASIKRKKYIYLFNKGNHYRDFTYIDDAIKYLDKIINIKMKKKSYFEIYNIASGKSINLLDYITIIEQSLNTKAKIKYKNMQEGDVIKTHGNIEKIFKLTNYKPKTDIRKGVENFIKWYNDSFI